MHFENHHNTISNILLGGRQCAGTYCQDKTCQAPYTPIPNMESALRGYDPVHSDPQKPYPEWDPGVKEIIFEATYQKSELNDQRV